MRVPRQRRVVTEIRSPRRPPKELAELHFPTPGPFCLRAAFQSRHWPGRNRENGRSPARSRRTLTEGRPAHPHQEKPPPPRSAGPRRSPPQQADGVPVAPTPARLIDHSRWSPTHCGRRSNPSSGRRIPAAPGPISRPRHDRVRANRESLTRRSSTDNARGSMSTASTWSSRRNASVRIISARWSSDSPRASVLAKHSRAVRAAFGAATTTAVAAALMSRATALIATEPTSCASALRSP